MKIAKTVCLLLISFLFIAMGDVDTGDYVLYEKKQVYEDTTYYIGIRVSGFQDKVTFLEIYKEPVIIKLDKIVKGDALISEYIEESKEVSYTDITIDFDNNEILIHFSDNSLQKVSFNYRDYP